MGHLWAQWMDSLRAPGREYCWAHVRDFHLDPKKECCLDPTTVLQIKKASSTDCLMAMRKKEETVEC